MPVLKEQGNCVGAAEDKLVPNCVLIRVMDAVRETIADDSSVSLRHLL